MRNLIFAFLCLFFTVSSFAGGASVTPIEPLKSSDMPFRLGGCGGVYFLAKPGKLTVTVMKNESGKTRRWMRAVLAGPDREILADVWFPGDGRQSAQRVEISCPVPAEGIYVLNITAPDDTQGSQLQWSFETNCEKYVVETSRGHRDARHLEPLAVFSPEHSGKICFPAPQEKFAVELSDLAPGAEVQLLNDADQRVALLVPDRMHRACCELPEDKTRRGLWKLAFNKFQAVAEIDELTRWKAVSSWEDSAAKSLWTPNPASWFDFSGNRRLLTPYRKEIGFDKGTRDLFFTLRNYDPNPKRVSLSLEFPEGVPPFLTLPQKEIMLKTNASIRLTCDDSAPGTTRVCRLRATSGEFSTYSTIVLRGKPDSSDDIKAPLTLRPYCNVSACGLEEFPKGEPYFDFKNRPYVFEKGKLWFYRNGQWRTARLENGSENLQPATTKIAFDPDGRIYAVGRMNGKFCYLWSGDGGETFHAVPFPVECDSADIEQFSGHNENSFPPPVTAYRKTSGRKPNGFWRQTCDMYLLLPQFRDGKIVFPAPIRVTEKSIGIAQHSGIPSTVVSRGDRTHIIWAEATDPADKSIPGVPTYAANCDRITGKLSKPVLIGYGPPANDVHNTPCIVMDGKGYLHAFVGTHGLVFQYARSLKPDSAADGWTPAANIGKMRGGMTYIGVVCDKNDRLHLIYRQWTEDRELFPSGSCAQLVTMNKSAMDQEWSKPRVLVRPSFTDYGVYYHKLSIDRTGRLFLSFDFWSTYWFYRNDFESFRTLLFSPDSGKNWRLADSSALTGK